MTVVLFSAWHVVLFITLSSHATVYVMESRLIVTRSVLQEFQITRRSWRMKVITVRHQVSAHDKHHPHPNLYLSTRLYYKSLSLSTRLYYKSLPLSTCLYYKSLPLSTCLYYKSLPLYPISTPLYYHSLPSFPIDLYTLIHLLLYDISSLENFISFLNTSICISDFFLLSSHPFSVSFPHSFYLTLSILRYLKLVRVTTFHV